MIYIFMDLFIAVLTYLYSNYLSFTKSEYYGYTRITVPKAVYFLMRPHLHTSFDFKDNYQVTICGLLYYFIACLPITTAFLVCIFLILSENPIHLFLEQCIMKYWLCTLLGFGIITAIYDEIEKRK